MKSNHEGEELDVQDVDENEEVNKDYDSDQD